MGTARSRRVAECRAEGSGCGESSGQASAAPLLPPGATHNVHQKLSTAHPQKTIKTSQNILYFSVQIL